MNSAPTLEKRTSQLSSPAASRTSAPSPKFTLAHIGVFLFVLVYYARPSDWIPGAAAIPIAKLVAGIAVLGFLGSLLTRPTATILALWRRRPIIAVVALYAWMWMTVPTAAWRGNSFEILISDFSEIVVIAALIAVSTTSLARLRRLLSISILVASVAAVFAVRSFLRLHASDQRIVGIFHNVFSNPNDLALNIVILLPFCVALLFLARGLMKVWWLGCTVVMTLGILASFSRAGFLALIAAVLMILVGLGVKGRKVAVLALVVLLGIAATLFLPQQFATRMDTIFNPSADTTGSAQARRQLLIDSVKLTAEHPVFGVGPGNFENVTKHWAGTHNIFTQLSSEAGIPALLLFLWVLRETFRDIRKAREKSEDRNMRLLVGAAQASMVALLVGTFFYHAIFQFFTYFPIAYATSLAGMAAGTVRSSGGPEGAAEASDRGARRRDALVGRL